jgi:AAA family ATP:ADP antiporter
LKLGAIAMCALPVAVGWVVLSTALGRNQKRLAAKTDDRGAHNDWPSDAPRI